MNKKKRHYAVHIGYQAIVIATSPKNAVNKAVKEIASGKIKSKAEVKYVEYIPIKDTLTKK